MITPIKLYCGTSEGVLRKPFIVSDSVYDACLWLITMLQVTVAQVLLSAFSVPCPNRNIYAVSLVA